MKACVLGFVLLCAWLPAGSQETTLDGRWLAKLSLPDGSSREVRIAIEDGKGTFQGMPRDSAKDRENPCTGRKFPLTVTNVAADAFVLHVEGSKALQGCPDFRWRLKRSDAGEYEGSLPNGQRYVLVRQP